MSAPGTQLERQAESMVFAQTSATEMPKSLAEIIAIAKIMAASGFYPDAKTAHQAAAIMMIGVQFGIPPAQALTAIHIVKGKPMLHYSALLSKVRQHPDYDYEIIESTAKTCSIQFYRKGEKCGVSTFTEANAKQQGTQNMDKFPDTMLLARATSNGIKRFCPDVINGMPIYVPGEIPEPTESASAELPMSRAQALTASIKATEAVEPEAVVDDINAQAARYAMSPEAVKALIDLGLEPIEIIDFKSWCQTEEIDWNDRALSAKTTDDLYVREGAVV